MGGECQLHDRTIHIHAMDVNVGGFAHAEVGMCCSECSCAACDRWWSSSAALELWACDSG